MLAHVEAQRVKTRGPNPNPTTQAQSKRCLPLFTKTQNIIKILPAGLPNPMLFWYLFRAFSLLVSQDTNMDPKGTQMEPKSAEMKPQGLPKVPKSLPTIPAQGATMESKGHPKR